MSELSRSSVLRMDFMIYTIGYANRDLSGVISLFEELGIRSLVDVRSSPFSSAFPQFNQDVVSGDLAAKRIGYFSLGHQLGPRVQEAEYYDSKGQVSFSKVAKSKRFCAGLARLKELSKEHPVAVMCAEKDPSVCHRALLVGHAAYMSGLEVAHILFENNIQTHEEMLYGLCDNYGLKEDMFSDLNDLWPIAYEKQVEKHAYRRSSVNKNAIPAGYA